MTEHVETPVVVGDRVQLVPGVNAPVPFEEKLTVDVGETGLLLVSVTVAVHVVGAETDMEEGEQASPVVVGCAVAAVTVSAAVEVLAM